MAICIREVGNINVLDIDGKIDINSSDLIETIGWLVHAGKVNILINMENVSLVDYNGLSILAIAYKNILNHKGKVKFVHANLATIELLKVVKLESVFEIYDDEASAVDSFSAKEIDSLPLRRKFQRLDIHIKVKYRLVGPQAKPKIFEGTALNLSASGLYIYTPYTLPLNSIVELEFILPGFKKRLGAAGKISWLADKEVQPHSFPGMGTSFVHLTAEIEKVIADFIERNATHRADTI